MVEMKHVNPLVLSGMYEQHYFVRGAVKPQAYLISESIEWVKQQA
jgi:hypothetical protein